MSVQSYQKTKFEKVFEKIGSAIDKKIDDYKMENILSVHKLLDIIKCAKLNNLEEKYNSNHKENYKDENTIFYIFEKESLSDEKSIDDQLLFYLAAKVLQIYPNGLADIFKEKIDEDHLINYNLTLKSPKNLKDYFILCDDKTDIEKGSFKKSGSDQVNQLNGFNGNLNYNLLASIRHKIFEVKTGNPTEIQNQEYKKMKDILKCFEYIDDETKKFFKYIIEIHYYLLREQGKIRLNEEIIFLQKLMIVVRTFNFLTNVNVSLKLIEEDYICMKFFTDEKSYVRLASFFNYKIQLKPYALKYHFFDKKFNPSDFDDENSFREEENDEENKTLFGINNISYSLDMETQNRALYDEKFNHAYIDYLEYIEKQNQGFIDMNNHLNFPPYILFDKNQIDKYKRYDAKDNFWKYDKIQSFKIKHQSLIENKEIFLNKEDSDFSKNLSTFRSIDKLRLLSSAFDHFFKLENSNNESVLENIFYQRKEENFIYRNQNLDLIIDSLNFFSSKTKYKLINHFRNLYGEEISFYLLWLQQIIISIFFPALISFIIFLLHEYCEKKNLLNDILLKTFDHELKVKHLFINIICLIPAMWCIIFLQKWKSTEKLYSLIWGCEKSEKYEPYQESYKCKNEIKYIFDRKIKIQDKILYNFKKISSMLISFSLVGLAIFCKIEILDLQREKLLENKDSLLWEYLPTIINAVLIKFLSITYRYIANYLSHWENHEKNSTRVSSLSLKIFLFEIMNNFFNYFYIGFIKRNRYKDGKNICLYESDCVKEIQESSYTSLLIIASINLIEVGIPYFFYYISYDRMISQKLKEKTEGLTDEQKKTVKLDENEINKIKKSDKILLGLENVDSDSLIEDYIEIMIYMGYIMTISTVAPLTPLIILGLLIFEKSVDTFKFYNLVKITSLNSTSGISVYNYMMNIILYFGTLSNVLFAFFTRGQTALDNTKILNKFLVIFIIENIILICIRLIKINDLPDWLNNLDLINKSYMISFFEKQQDNLPHYSLKIHDQNQCDDFSARTKSIQFYCNENDSEVESKIKEMKLNKKKDQHNSKCCC